MSEIINFGEKINIFTVKLANNKKFIITVYDNDMIISTLINNKFNNSVTTNNKSNFIDIVDKINTELFNNPIENRQFIQYDRLQGGNISKFIFEVISETFIIEENKINSIVKIINDAKLVITVFDDNIFITRIKDNNRPSSFYYNNDCGKFNTMDVITHFYFSQTQKKVLSQHHSYMQGTCKN